MAIIKLTDLGENLDLARDSIRKVLDNDYDYCLDRGWRVAGVGRAEGAVVRRPE